MYKLKFFLLLSYSLLWLTLAACSNNPAANADDLTPGKDSTIVLPGGFSASKTAADLGRARHIAVAPNGDIYVADGYGKDFIIQYDAKGNYTRHFGGRGDGDRFLLNAHGICIDKRSAVPTLQFADQRVRPR